MKRDWILTSSDGTCSHCNAEFWSLNDARDHHKETGHATSFRREYETLFGDPTGKPIQPTKSPTQSIRGGQ